MDRCVPTSNYPIRMPAGSAYQSLAAGHFVLEPDQARLHLDDLEDEAVLDPVRALETLIHARDLAGHEVPGPQLPPELAGGHGIVDVALTQTQLLDELRLPLPADD